MADSVVRITEGVIGSGKSVRVVWWLVEDFLPNNPDGGLFITNVPIDRETIARYVERKHKLDYEKTLARLQLIPQDVLESWERGISQHAYEKAARKDPDATEASITPFEFFGRYDLTGAHIAIDEAQNYWGRGTRDKYWLEEMRSFVSRIRHFGATLELITQDEQQVALEIVRLASLGYLITPNEARCLPILNIRFKDLYEIWAKLGGKYDAAVAIQERVKAGRRWTNQGKPFFFYRKPEYFELYNSHGAVKNGLSSSAPIFEYQKRTWPSLLWWFFRRNVGAFLKVFMASALVVFLFGFDGITTVNEKFVGYVMTILPAPQVNTGAVADTPAGKSPPDESPPVPAEPPPELSPEQRAAMEQLQSALNEAQAKRQALASEIAAREQEIAESARALAALRQRVERDSEIVILDRDSLVFRSGEIVRLNERVRYGLHQGKTLDAIDYDDQSVRFDGGDVVRMRMRAQPIPRAEGDGSEVGP